MTVNCQELITFLDDYVGGVLPAERRAEFERHLAVCSSCQAYLASYRDTIRLARDAELRIEDVPDELVRAILAAARK